MNECYQNAISQGKSVTDLNCKEKAIRACVKIVREASRWNGEQDHVQIFSNPFSIVVTTCLCTCRFYRFFFS